MIKTIMGLDPSLSSTGYFVIAETVPVFSGRITTSKKDGTTEDRIRKILKEIIRIMDVHQVTEVSCEDGFCGKNSRTSLQLQKLRGAVLGVCFTKNIMFYEYQPSFIRKVLGVSGNASKEEVADCITQIYPERCQLIGPYSDKANKNKTSDIYDAAAAGIIRIKVSATGKG